MDRPVSTSPARDATDLDPSVDAHADPPGLRRTSFHRTRRFWQNTFCALFRRSRPRSRPTTSRLSLPQRRRIRRCPKSGGLPPLFANALTSAHLEFRTYTSASTIAPRPESDDFPISTNLPIQFFVTQMEKAFGRCSGALRRHRRRYHDLDDYDRR